MKKKYLLPLGLWVLFEAIAVAFWLAFDHIFYLFNFTYIGTCLAVGIFLYVRKVKYVRNILQFAVGLYMLIFLGIIGRENMQIEGFWYLLFLGVFQAAVIHYAVAKICGPLLFGRAWCGYACWTAMVLDLLPYRTSETPRRKFGYIRYIVFLISLIFSIILFLLRVPVLGDVMLYSFIIGNILYYLIGVILAFTLKDNRAFCKYVCPITVFLKPASYFSLLRIKTDTSRCVACNKCVKICPMDVDMMNDSRKRRHGTECILCLECVNVCPKKALHI